MDKQNDFLTNYHVQKPKNSRITIIIAVAIVLVLSGSIYFWQKSVLQRVQKEMEERIVLLQQEVASAEKKVEDIEKKHCKGVWENGVCLLLSCVDSDINEKPDDIFIKGSVTYTNKEGVTNTVYDECNGSKTQVNEMWCYESPKGSGNYVQGNMVYNCPKGCFDGACIR